MSKGCNREGDYMHELFGLYDEVDGESAEPEE